MANWTVPIDSLVEQAKGQVDDVVRRATFQLFSAVVRRSPVGNPDLWKANAAQTYRRETFNLFAEVLGARQKSGKALRKQFPNSVGAGYVGGQFRANWNVSPATPNSTTTESTDRSRGDAEAQKALSTPAGGVLYLANGLPYARRLEYEGWSKQAPSGMVRLSVTEFRDFVEQAARKR